MSSVDQLIDNVLDGQDPDELIEAKISKGMFKGHPIMPTEVKKVGLYVASKDDMYGSTTTTFTPDTEWVFNAWQPYRGEGVHWGDDPEPRGVPYREFFGKKWTEIPDDDVTLKVIYKAFPEAKAGKWDKWVRHVRLLNK